MNLTQHIVDEAETEGCAEEPSTCMGIGQEGIIFSHDSSNVLMKSTLQTQDIQYDDRPPVIANAIIECLNYLKVVEHKNYEHECRSANFYPDHREEVSGVTEGMNAALEPAKTQVDVGQKSGMDTLDKNGENLQESSGPETSSTVLRLEVALKGGNVNPVSYTRGEESEDRKGGPTTVLLEDWIPPMLNADGDNHGEGHASIFHEPLIAASPLSHKEDCAGMLNSVFDHGNKCPLKGLIEGKKTYDEIGKIRVTTNTAKDLKVNFVGGLNGPMRSLEVNEDSPGVRKMVHFSTRKEDGCWEDDNKIRHRLLTVDSAGNWKGIAEAFDGVLEHSNKPYTRPKKNEGVSNEENESCQKPSIGINGNSKITATAEHMKVTVNGENGHLINYSEWNEESQCKQVVSLVDGRCDSPQKVEYTHIHQQRVTGSWEQRKEEVGYMKDRRNDVLELDSELHCKGSIKGEETYAENAETFDKLDEGSIKGSDMCNDKVAHQGFIGHSDPMPRAEVAGNNGTKALVDLTKGREENES